MNGGRGTMRLRWRQEAPRRWHVILLPFGNDWYVDPELCDIGLFIRQVIVRAQTTLNDLKPASRRLQ